MAMEPQHAYQNYQQSQQKLGTFLENRVGRYFKNHSYQKITRIKVLLLD